jgi:hypothetical protein
VTRSELAMSPSAVLAIPLRREPTPLPVAARTDWDTTHDDLPLPLPGADIVVDRLVVGRNILLPPVPLLGWFANAAGEGAELG